MTGQKQLLESPWMLFHLERDHRPTTGWIYTNIMVESPCEIAQKHIVIQYLRTKISSEMSFTEDSREIKTWQMNKKYLKKVLY